MNARKLAATTAAFGLTLGLIGAGVSAQWTDSATAQAGVSVGAFACTISSPNANAVISNGGHTVSWTMPEIQNSGQGPYQDFSIDLHNTGQMPERVSWTIEGPTYANSHLGVTSGSPDMHTAINLAPGASQHYDYLGFQIAETHQQGDPNYGHPLDNNDLGKTFTASYTASCAEQVAVQQALHPTYVGGTSVDGAGPLALPSGWVAGDLALAYTVRSGSSASPYPAGFISIYASTTQRTNVSYRVLQASDASFTATNASGFEIVIYHHATLANLGGNPPYAVSGAYVASGTTAFCYEPANAPMPTDGTGVVVCLGADSVTTDGMRSLAVAGPPVLANRSAGFAGGRMGAADTSNASVTSWPNMGTPIGSYALSGASRAKNTLSVGLVYAP